MRAGLTLLTTIAVAAVAVPAEAASWGYATAGSTNVKFDADWKATNKVVITRSGRTVTIDDRLEIKPGKGCKRVKGDKTKVRCTTTKTPTKVYVELRDRNDSVVNKSNLRLIANGGSGNDKLTGGPKADVLDGDDFAYRSGSGNDKIYGGAGNDDIDAGDGSDYVSAGDGNDRIAGDCDCLTGRNRAGNDELRGGNGNDVLAGMYGHDKLYGGNGNDFLNGAIGRDRLEGGAGDDQLLGDLNSGPFAADVVLGGSGRDTVDYQYAKAVSVDLDGVSGDDGLPGERDTVGADVENLVGGAGNDRLIGNNAANDINGLAGDDVILGGAGDDQLYGGDGRNKIYGEAGNDLLRTAYGVSRLDGGLNTDVCVAKPEDTVVGCETRQVW
ncbi:hemolysin type calcium-binding protein [Actinoplanes lutulentus]|uniref:Hemolysin type calcium-binding protein n=2 Tax=Actinoplanes lutulentus TaxID=1287878 RepID=A0A327Z2L2_9ACTN|nr:hemolysin type calcium-binding protein [Actinoplanes lutulentus]